MKAKNTSRKCGRSPKLLKPGPGPTFQTPPPQNQAIPPPSETAVEEIFNILAAEQNAFDADDEQLAYSLSEDKLSTFSIVLRQILGRNHVQIARVAKELGVAENTVYRWINGRSEPRAMHLIGLLEVLPEDRSNLTFAINKTFPAVLTPQIPSYELHRDIARNVMEMTAALPDHDTHLQKMQEYIFRHAFLLFDSQLQGLCVTYAKLMQPRDDGQIHTLRESMVQGTYPWPASYPCKAFFGSATLVGRAALTLHSSTWDDIGEEDRLLVEIDDFELSACAYPVMRRGGLAGVFMVSSHDPALFRDLYACQAVADLAHLFSLTLPTSAFTSPKLLKLRPMPGLLWQRKKLNAEYNNYITRYARRCQVSRPEAEVLVIKDLEREFEEIAERQLEKKLQISRRISSTY